MVHVIYRFRVISERANALRHRPVSVLIHQDGIQVRKGLLSTRKRRAFSAFDIEFDHDSTMREISLDESIDGDGFHVFDVVTELTDTFTAIDDARSGVAQVVRYEPEDLTVCRPDSCTERREELAV
jgi:hypothetical protein